MLEYEKKLMLHETEYKTLCKKLPLAKPVSQTNYYYDTPDLAMNRAATTCRIRKKDGVYTATVKTHRAGDRDCSVEQSAKVRNEKDTSMFVNMGMTLQGVLHTNRLSVTGYPGINIHIDQNTYLDVVDYELEIEYTPTSTPACTLALSLIAELLGYSFHTPAQQEFLSRALCAQNKSQRFFARREYLTGGR